MSIIDKLLQTERIFVLKPANQYTIWKVLGLFVVGILMAGTIMVFYFIYLYSYLTLSNINTIIILNSNLAADVINIKTFQNTEQMIKWKNSLPNIPEKIRNIFYYIDIATPTTTLGSVEATIITSSSTQDIVAVMQKK